MIARITRVIALRNVDECYSACRNVSSLGASRAPSSSSLSTASKVNFPKLTIRPFGELTSWTTFWDSYKAAIHDNVFMRNCAYVTCVM